MNGPILTINQATEVQLDSDPHAVAHAVRELGFKPVRAWIPDNSEKAGTAGAERTRRSREKAEQSGLKQLSITLPSELHPILKTLARRTKAGETAETVLVELFPNLAGGLGSSPIVESKPELHLETPSGWRRWVIRWLLR